MSNTTFTVLTVIMFGTIELVCVVVLVLLFKIMGRYKKLDQDYLKVWDNYNKTDRLLKKSTTRGCKKNETASPDSKIGASA